MASSLRAKLFTHEDPLQIHKSLGLFCLVNFVYRFSHVGPTDMRFTSDWQTLAVLGLHAMLSLTSLIFQLPKKRIKGGYRIWPEYRLHSIAFALRSLVGMLVTWVELRRGAEPNYWINVGIVLGSMALADAGSKWCGEANRSSSIRDLDAGPSTRFFFSAMQFHGTFGCLLGLRRFSMQFIYVWVIQLNAFLMTLRRKNLAPHALLVTGYGFMLVFGFCVAASELHSAGLFMAVNTLSNLAVILRLGCRLNKYLMWAGLGVLTHLARPSAAPDHWFAKFWPGLSALSVAVVFALGILKVQKAKQDANKDAKGV